MTTASSDPLALFAEWFDAARRSEPRDPEAMALASVDAQGQPNVRMVLLKGFDHRGFVFYTNRESIKGAEIAANPRAAMCLYWKSLNRQVRVGGTMAPVGDAESDAYFATRHRESQIGAWASRQSRELESRFALEKAVAAYLAKFGLGAIPRPPHWGGYRLAPERIEFWQERPFRMHDRTVYTRAGDAWSIAKLYP